MKVKKKEKKPEYELKNAHLNHIQALAVELMKNDLRFLYTIICNDKITTPEYFVALIPYMGLVIDGIEDWINAYNNSTKGSKILLPTFNSKEQEYYSKMRNSIKLFEKGYEEVNKQIESKYYSSDDYFSSFGKLKILRRKKYDIYGVLFYNSIPCNNTILDQIVIPNFSYETLRSNGKSMRIISTIGGRYIKLFDATKSYTINKKAHFLIKDFGGKIKSPFGENYNEKFLLFSILCQIQFIIYAVNDFIIDDVSTKLRFSYILYYYLCYIIPQINLHLGLKINMNKKYVSEKFRNAMAHYKLGVVLKENDVIDNDPMYGLTQMFFNEDFFTVKNNIILELNALGKQIQKAIYKNDIDII